MTGHMRHGSPPRLLALQSILSPNRRESLPTPSAGVRITSLDELVALTTGPGLSQRSAAASLEPLFAGYPDVAFDRRAAAARRCCGIYLSRELHRGEQAVRLIVGHCLP